MRRARAAGSSDDPLAQFVAVTGELNPRGYESNKRPGCGGSKSDSVIQDEATRDDHGVACQAGGQASVAGLYRMKFDGSPGTRFNVEISLVPAFNRFPSPAAPAPAPTAPHLDGRTLNGVVDDKKYLKLNAGGV